MATAAVVASTSSSTSPIASTSTSGDMNTSTLASSSSSSTIASAANRSTPGTTSTKLNPNSLSFSSFQPQSSQFSGKVISTLPNYAEDRANAGVGSHPTDDNSHESVNQFHYPQPLRSNGKGPQHPTSATTPHHLQQPYPSTYYPLQSQPPQHHPNHHQQPHPYSSYSNHMRHNGPPSHPPPPIHGHSQWIPPPPAHHQHPSMMHNVPYPPGPSSSANGSYYYPSAPPANYFQPPPPPQLSSSVSSSSPSSRQNSYGGPRNPYSNHQMMSPPLPSIMSPQLLPPWEQQQQQQQQPPHSGQLPNSPPQLPLPSNMNSPMSASTAGTLADSPMGTSSQYLQHPHQFNNMSPILEPPRSSFLIRPDSSIEQRLSSTLTKRNRPDRPEPKDAPGFSIAPNVQMPKEWRVQYGIASTRKIASSSTSAKPPAATTNEALSSANKHEESTTPNSTAINTSGQLSPIDDRLLSTASTSATVASTSAHSSPILTPASPTTTTTTIDELAGAVAGTGASTAPATPLPSTPKSPSTAPATTAAHAIRKSWADLLRTPSNSVPSSPSTIANGHGSTSSPSNQIESPRPSSSSNFATKLTLLQLLSGVENDFSNTSITMTPRGLINNGNLCFANTILQVLVFTSPFKNLLLRLKRETKNDLSGRTPSLDAMISFLEEFRSSSQTTIVKSSTNHKMNSRSSGGLLPNVDTFIPSSDYADPFVPESVYDSLKNNKRFDAMRRGHQEDAEEFLGFFLDTLHDEILMILDRADREHAKVEQEKGKGKEEEGEGWMEVGSKGRMATTRTTETRESPITRIFGGQLRSILRCPGQKDSITLEPYQRLQLDIEPHHVRTIEDALKNLTLPEPLPDFVSRTGVKVEATKQVYLETLPPVLILHLKRFVYDNVGGVQKSGKLISYGTELTIGDQLVGPSKRTGRDFKYQLFAVVYHHGNYASGGHYTVAVRQQIHSNAWLHIDDTSIRPITPNEVAVAIEKNSSSMMNGAGSNWDEINGDGEKRAYLLMYNRVA